MVLDKSSTSSGLFRAFKESVQRGRREPKTWENHNSEVERDTSTSGEIYVITDTKSTNSFDKYNVLVALEKAFLAVEGSRRHIHAFEERISSSVTEAIDVLFLNQDINNYFKDALYNIDGALRLTAASNALSIFKSFKQITASIIFITTRNFSIQKDLSISA